MIKLTPKRIAMTEFTFLKLAMIKNRNNKERIINKMDGIDGENPIWVTTNFWFTRSHSIQVG